MRNYFEKLCNLSKRTRKRVRPFLHGAIWFTLFIINTNFMLHFFPLGNALLQSFIVHSVLASVFYFNKYVLLPKLLFRRKYLLYVISAFVLLGVIGQLNDFYFDIFNYDLVDLRKLHKADEKTRFLVGGSFFMIVIGSVLQFAKRFRVQEKQKEELENQKVTAELQALKAQVNPHFLFNTLNNIYALSLDKAEPEVSEMIMSLSEISRYMLYETAPEVVSLHKEIQFLNSYIELEKLRFEKVDRLKVLLSSGREINIAPLLFIPFVENAFKHSRIVDDENAWIHISIHHHGDDLHFKCENSKPKTTFQKDKTGGIGLENVKKRLSLIYPSSHRLNIHNADDRFVVHLTLTLLNEC